MAEKTKEEELKQKLLDYFDKRLTDLTTKFQTDIDSIEKIKYDYVDTVIKKFADVEEEHKKHQAEEKTEKEKHDKEKNDKEKKNDKKTDDGKHEKVQKKKIDPTARPKTPMATSSKKPRLKDAHETKDKKDTKTTKTTAGKAPAGGKAAGAKKADTSKRPVTGKVDPKSKTMTKKGAANAKKDPKKGKKDNKKTNKKEEDKKEEEHHEEEEKKPVVINPKYIYTTNDELKKNPGLSCIYFVLKGKYIGDKKKFLHLATHSPLIYKTLGGNMKFLLDDKKKDAQNKANEIEKFLNNYGDLNNYLTKEFAFSKKAINSIAFFKKKKKMKF